jgi:hypothetical protein
MSRLTTTPLAVSADYADALLTARRAKNWLFLFLMIGLLAQLSIFFVAKFTDVLKIKPSGEAEIAMPKVDVDREPAATTAPTTGETEVETRRLFPRASTASPPTRRSPAACSRGSPTPSPTSARSSPSR